MVTEKITSLVLRYPKLIIIATIGITILLSFFVSKLEVNPDVFSNLPEDDKTAQLFNKIGEEYGGNYLCLIGLKAEDVFTTQVLSSIKQITDSARTIAGVGAVNSLTNILDIQGDEWGIVIGQLVDPYNLPHRTSQLDSLKTYVLNKALYKGGLVSPDAKMTVVLVRLEEDIDKTEVASKLKEKITAIGIPEKLFFGGQPFVMMEFGHVILRDITFIGPVTLLFILLVLYFGLRSLRAVLFPVLTVVISCIWTFGLMGLLGVKISIITSVIPILLVAIGSAYTLHMMNRIYETKAKKGENTLKKAISFIIVPIFFAAITTLFGFMSFVFGSYLDMISKFGIFTSVGIAVALLLSITFVPALMSFSRNNTRNTTKTSEADSQLLTRFLKAITRTVFNHPERIVWIWIFLILIFILGIFRLERSVNITDYFKKDNPIRITENILQEKLGGTSPVYISIKGDLLQPEVLKMIRKTEDYLTSFPEVVHAQSIADLIEEMHFVMGEGRTIPDDKEKISNLWFLLEGQDVLQRLVNYEKNEAIIHATFGSDEMDKMRDFVSKMNAFFIANETENISFELSGMPSLLLCFDESILRSQLQSLALAIILVLLAVSLLGRSFKMGFFAITPILSTLCILYGFMGIVSIPLDLATVLVGSISIGIGIDYSIHIMNQVNADRKQGRSLQTAISHAIQISGKSIIINVFSVSAGFLVLILSSLVPLQRFGILVAVTMLGSGFGSVTLLPSILLIHEKLINKHHHA